MSDGILEYRVKRQYINYILQKMFELMMLRPCKFLAATFVFYLGGAGFESWPGQTIVSGDF
jgi:hypothetical protein